MAHSKGIPTPRPAPSPSLSAEVFPRSLLGASVAEDVGFADEINVELVCSVAWVVVPNPVELFELVAWIIE